MPRTGSSRTRNDPYLEASCSAQVVSHADDTESHWWVMPVMKQSLLNAATFAGRCQIWMWSPISRLRHCGHRLPGSACGSTARISNRSGVSFATYSTHCAQFSASESFCRIRSLRW